MSDSSPYLGDIKEETSSTYGTIPRTSQPPLITEEPTTTTPPTEHKHSFLNHEHPPPGSTVSHVDVDFFDPNGVQHLRRTLTNSPSYQDPKSEGCRQCGRETFRESSSDTTLAGDQPFDFEKTLRDIIRKREEHNIKTRELGVVFKDLEVVGLGATASYQETLGSLFSPKTIIENIQTLRHPPLRNILSGFEGVVRPGEMILVLGSPGSGCTTLLKTLANQTDEFHSVSGERHYDSLSPTDIQKHFRGDVQYCPEDDIHFPTLTVEQTLKFAATTRTPRGRGDLSREQYVDNVVEMLMTIFGLRHTRNTPVGDAAIRGVSGGEKKRVSIAEALASRALVGAWDNSTRGLDASTALEFVRALRIATDTFRFSTIVSIYQAGESLYQHFDKVCVIYEGRMAYFGAADAARQYFIDLGYEPANRQTTADFLVAVTDPNGRIVRSGMEGRVPRSAGEFAKTFLESELGEANRRDVESYLEECVGKPERRVLYEESAYGEFAKHSNKRSPYLLSIPQQAAAVMKRRVQILNGNLLASGLNLFSFIFQALIIGSVFLKLEESTSAFFSRGGVLFFSLLFAGLTAMAEIPALYQQRPIVLRHDKAALYHPFIESLAVTLVDIPITFAILVVFCIVTYFMVGLQRSADQFFIFFLFVFMMAIVMKAWFRAIAAAFASEATAQTLAGISILILSIYTGYNIPKPSMIGALRWLTYINPLRYGFEVMMTNEFRTLKGKCASLVPQGPGYENITIDNQVCTTVGAVPGQDYVDGLRYVELSYGFLWSNTWMNLGICIAFGVGFLAILLLFTEFNTSTAAESAVVAFKRGSKPPVLKSHNDEEEVNEKSPAPFDGSEKASIDAAQPMTDIFSWQHLNYTVPIQGLPDRLLLSDVSGYVAPGKLTALMGESGAGKTTLLNVLAQRVNVGVVTGDKLVNGQPLPPDFQAQTGYVQQMDTHAPTSTVREALLFSARLRQPPSVPDSEKEAYVEKCLQMCGLEAYADAAVGSLSIEHRKRTTIAVELAAKPKLLLFLDEPTSGLDSQSAWAIVSFLRSLADKGQAILCTIHQPSAELFQVFDRLLLLKKGGKTSYFGDLGDNASTLISYFERNGARQCMPDENPAEYMLDVIGAGATATSAQDWYDVWLKAPESEAVQREIDTILAEGRKRQAVEATIHSEFATSWPYQVSQLLKRDAEAHWRDPTYLMAKLVLNVVGGLFIGFTFFKAKATQQGTQNKLFSIFMVTILSVPLSNQLQVPFIAMRNIYEIRERPSRMYSWTALVTSQILIELPWNILGTILLFFSWFWTVGFPSERAGYVFVMLCIAFPLYYTTIAQAVAAMAPSAEIAALLFSFLFSFVLTFNGVLQPFRQLGWWRWMYRLSPFTYLIEGLLGYAMGRQEITCSAIEYVSVNPPSGLTCGDYLNPYISFAGGYLNNAEATSACQFCSIRTSDQFLNGAFNIYYEHAWRNFGFMFVYIAFNTACIYLFTYLCRIRTGSLFGSLKKLFVKKN
ncbi:pleiotropic drug resistance ABC transporter [Cyathus striatus]|nr:pleiotropic drug resistance ABC transporter [Cyathus striatus]